MVSYDTMEVIMRKFCGNCEVFEEVNIIKRTDKFNVKNVNISAEIITLYCKYCGQEVYDREIEIENDINILDTYKRHKNLLTTENIIDLRKKYQISQSTFSQILGFGAKTITRYENGSIQDYAHDNLIRLIECKENFKILWIRQKDKLSEFENQKLAKLLNE